MIDGADFWVEKLALIWCGQGVAGWVSGADSGRAWEWRSARIAGVFVLRVIRLHYEMRGTQNGSGGSRKAA